LISSLELSNLFDDFKPKNLMQVYSELSLEDFERLQPPWMVPVREAHEFTKPKDLKP
jgi:hypothetical protein